MLTEWRYVLKSFEKSAPPSAISVFCSIPKLYSLNYTKHQVCSEQFTETPYCVLLTFFVFFKPFQTSSVTVNKAVIGLETSQFCLSQQTTRLAFIDDGQWKKSIFVQWTVYYIYDCVFLTSQFFSSPFHNYIE